MDSVTLPPDLEQFAAEAVASGRFRDRDELVRTGSIWYGAELGCTFSFQSSANA